MSLKMNKPTKPPRMNGAGGVFLLLPSCRVGGVRPSCSPGTELRQQRRREPSPCRQPGPAPVRPLTAPSDSLDDLLGGDFDLVFSCFSALRSSANPNPKEGSQPQMATLFPASDTGPKLGVVRLKHQQMRGR